MISVECFRSGRSPLPAARTVEGQGVCVVVRDANEQALGYFYFEEETGPAIGGRRRLGDYRAVSALAWQGAARVTRRAERVVLQIRRR
jgi:hypothetical protein